MTQVDSSIIGAAVAAAVWPAAKDRPTHARVGSLHAFARVTDAGTLVTEVTLRPTNRYTYTCRLGALSTGRRYIRARNPALSVNRLATRLLRDWTAARPLHDARESLYRLAESRIVPDSWTDNPPLLRPMDYSKMTVDDVAAWRPIVESLPLKP